MDNGNQDQQRPIPSGFETTKPSPTCLVPKHKKGESNHRSMDSNYSGRQHSAHYYDSTSAAIDGGSFTAQQGRSNLNHYPTHSTHHHHYHHHHPHPHHSLHPPTMMRNYYYNQTPHQQYLPPPQQQHQPQQILWPQQGLPIYPFAAAVAYKDQPIFGIQHQQPYQQHRQPSFVPPPSNLPSPSNPNKRKRQQQQQQQLPLGIPLHLFSCTIPYDPWHEKVLESCFGNATVKPDFVSINEIKTTTTLNLLLVHKKWKRIPVFATPSKINGQISGLEYELPTTTTTPITENDISKAINEIICNCAVYCIIRNDQRLKISYLRTQCLTLSCQGCGRMYLNVSFFYKQQSFKITLYDTCQCNDGSKCYQVANGNTIDDGSRKFTMNNPDLLNSFVLLRQILHYPESFHDETQITSLHEDLKETFQFNLSKRWIKSWYQKWKVQPSKNPLGISPNATIYDAFTALLQCNKKQQQQQTKSTIASTETTTEIQQLKDENAKLHGELSVYEESKKGIITIYPPNDYFFDTQMVKDFIEYLTSEKAILKMDGLIVDETPGIRLIQGGRYELSLKKEESDAAVAMSKLFLASYRRYKSQVGKYVRAKGPVMAIKTLMVLQLKRLQERRKKLPIKVDLTKPADELPMSLIISIAVDAQCIHLDGGENIMAAFLSLTDNAPGTWLYDVPTEKQIRSLDDLVAAAGLSEEARQVFIQSHTNLDQDLAEFGDLVCMGLYPQDEFLNQGSTKPNKFGTVTLVPPEQEHCGPQCDGPRGLAFASFLTSDAPANTKLYDGESQESPVTVWSLYFILPVWDEASPQVGQELLHQLWRVVSNHPRWDWSCHFPHLPHLCSMLKHMEQHREMRMNQKFKVEEWSSNDDMFVESKE